MSNQSSSRLEQVIALYLEAIEAGSEPDRESLLAEHSDLADELQLFFQNHDVIRGVGVKNEPDSEPQIESSRSEIAAHPETVNQFQANEEKISRNAQAVLAVTELGGYSLVRELGAGGMGQVFLALHRRMNRQVAIKVLPTELAQDVALVRRFHREAQVAAQLDHSNIVTAYDAGQENDVHYLVMEYVDGADLGAIVRHNGSLELRDAIRCIIQAGSGISHAHENGVIHRDIKPSNLLLGQDGVVKVLDMGLARWSVSVPDKTASDLSSSGMIMGTIDYLAPEQAMDSKAADQRSDLYSLGCSLFYLIHGEPIYPRDSVVEKLLAHREADPPCLVEDGDVASKELNEIFHRMIARNPSDRFDSIHDACAALQEWAGLGDSDLKVTISISKPPIQSPHASTVERERAHHIDTTRMTNLPQRALRSRTRWWIVTALASVTVLGLLSVPYLIKLWTPDGTLIVKCYLEGAHVEIDAQRRMTILAPSSKSEYTFDLPPGEHRVRVLMPDGTEMRSESVVIESRKGTLFEVSFEGHDKTDKPQLGAAKQRSDPEPNVHSVAQDGSAEHTTIASALAACQANDTVRVLDAAEYSESVTIRPLPRHQGITVQFVGNARWRAIASSANSAPRSLEIVRSDVTIRGVNFFLDPPGYAVTVGGQAHNVRFEDCSFEGTGVGIQFETIAGGELPSVVTSSRFTANIGVLVNASSNVLVFKNDFSNCEQAMVVKERVSHVLLAGNTISTSRMGGIQSQHLDTESHHILFANNSFLNCRAPIRIWENGVPDVSVRLVNNVTLNSNGIGWHSLNSSGDGYSANSENGEAFSKKWFFSNNFREGKRQSDAGWIPPSTLDHLLPKIEVLSRNHGDSDYLQPSIDSPLATSGVGDKLPSYVGAVPPSDTLEFDWEKYFNTVFKSESNTAE